MVKDTSMISDMNTCTPEIRGTEDSMTFFGIAA